MQNTLPRQEPAKRNVDHQEVLRLARKGLSVEVRRKEAEKACSARWN